MLLFLIMVGLCFAGGTSSPFNFRENCAVKHCGRTYSAVCDGRSLRTDQKDVYLDSRTTTSMTELELIYFTNATFDSSVQLEKITIKNTNTVSVFVNNLKLKTLIVENVNELSLNYKESHVNTRMEVLNLSSINQLYFKSDSVFYLSGQLMKFSQVGDMPIDSLRLQINAKNCTIDRSKIQLKGSSTMTAKAESVVTEDSILYLNGNGYLSITADTFLLKNTEVDLENGAIHLVDSKNTMFTKNSFYHLAKKTIAVIGSTNVQFLDNDILMSDIIDLLSLNSGHVMFKNNMFDCGDCSLKEKLFPIDLGDIGDFNFCYTDCSLSLNSFERLLENSCFCGNNELKINFTQMCIGCGPGLESPLATNSTFMGLITWLIIILIALALVMCLSVFLLCKGRFFRFKKMAESNSSSQELDSDTERTGQSRMIYRREANVCNNDENIYEPVIYS